MTRASDCFRPATSTLIGKLRIGAAFLVATAAACGTNPRGPGTGSGPTDPGIAVAPALSTEAQERWDQLQAGLTAATTGLDAQTLAAKRTLPFKPIAYDPRTAAGMAEIQASRIALSPQELEILGREGFVIAGARKFPEFTYGYATVYSEDLPVFVSADSILHAVHRSYDRILAAIEQNNLVAALTTLLDRMRMALAAGTVADLGDEVEADADLYLAVARSLLDATGTVAPVAGGSASAISDFVKAARAASGSKMVVLFGAGSEMDFSQFKPRGHYTDTPELSRYFQSMIWLGRTELPILVTEGGKSVLRRRALAGALGLAALMDADTTAAWNKLDQVIHAFVGEPDSMSPANVAALYTDLGVSSPSAALALPDQTLAAEIVAGAYGAQRIASQIVMAGPHEGTLPLPASFLLMGQRYVVDSHVFSNVTYDRVNVPDKTARMLPNPLDVAYAALGNDQAVSLLASELSTYGYAPHLEKMRVLASEHGAPYWDANLYNVWLSALRALSPTVALGTADRGGLPAVAASEAWGRRILSTQLASWAELRRDTILYVKQSYSVGIVCEFPDAYVDPYPEVFARVGAFARLGGALVDKLALETTLGADVRAYFGHLADVAEILRQMAENQRTGAAHSAAHLAFINRTVQVQQVCGSATSAGWYPELFFRQSDATEFSPTIADVHTAPTDAGGSPVGWVLHVATAHPRLFVTTMDTCTGPRAYVGVVSSYHEKLTTGLDRWDDKRWETDLGQNPPAEMPWVKDLVAP